MTLRYDWTIDDLRELAKLPFTELVFRAQSVHRENFPNNKIQLSTLLSVKTGGCPEDCKYCPQSAHYDTGLDREGLMKVDAVLEEAKAAKEGGATRFCMGAAWRKINDGPEFDQVLDMVEGVSKLGLEVCCTMGMLTESQADRLKDAGCDYYNHNLDTSPDFYSEIISTRDYQDRLDTLKRVRDKNIKVCCGGIVGMGEKLDDRLELIRQLAIQEPHPESVPINLLIRVDGTPLQGKDAVDPIEFVRVIAISRIVMPRSFVRLSAGRTQMSDETQALCFLAGANSIFVGDKLLTASNPQFKKDQDLLGKLGLEYYGQADLKNEAKL